MIGQRKGWRGLGCPKLLRSFSFIALAVLFLLSSCGGGSPPSPITSKEKAAPLAKREASKEAAKKEAEKKEEPAQYAYSPAGKPDPFKPFIQLTAVRGQSSVPLTPLQKYEVNQLKLVAIIASPDGNVALVEDGTGKGFFLKRGVAIGKNDGKVTKILRDRVVVEEVFQDIYGQTKTQEVILHLHKPEEGGES